MTAEEARTITKAALVNYALLAKIDKEIEKAAREGKYQLTYNFMNSHGLSKEEYTSLCDRYEKVGFNVTRGLIREENPSLQLSWYDDPGFETNTNNTETNID